MSYLVSKKWMQIIIAGFFVFSVAGGFVPVPVQAATAPVCKCFCSSSSGAVEIGNFSTSDCQLQCLNNKATGRLVACAASFGQYPNRSPVCFTEAQCAAQDGRFGNFQPTDCMPKSHFCFPGQPEYTLAVPFGEVQVVKGFAGYVQSGYNYLLRVAVTIAIVMVMIGGLQYALGAGSQEQVSKGKKRIVSAIVGLVLLLFAYVILYTVNPNLIALRMPGLPMIKKVVLLGEESCESLKEKKFEIGTGDQIEDIFTAEKGVEPKCGAGTVILKDDLKNTVAEGTTCDFKDCSPETEKVCYTGSNFAGCFKCTEVRGIGGVAGLVPNNSVCSSLVLKDTDTKSDPPEPHMRNYCFWQSATQRLSEADPLSACVEFSIDCTKIQTCSAYDTLILKMPTVVKGLNIPITLELLPLFTKVNLETICRSDPCKAGKKEGGQSCRYVTGTISGDCVKVE